MSKEAEIQKLVAELARLGLDSDELRDECAEIIAAAWLNSCNWDEAMRAGAAWLKTRVELAGGNIEIEGL
jgi:hypothetical protein